MEVLCDDFLCAVDDPCENGLAAIFIQPVGVVLDVTLALNEGIERDDQQPAPCAGVVSSHLREMVGVQHQSVAWNEMEWVFVLLLSLNLIGAAKLLDNGGVQTSAFLQFGSNQQTLSVGLGQFRLHIAAASDRECISGDIAAVAAKHTGDDIPEGGFTIPALAVGDDECLHIHLADCGKTDHSLYIFRQLGITAEDGIQRRQPFLHALIAWGNGRDLGDVITGLMFLLSVLSLAKVVGAIRCVQQKPIGIQLGAVDF